MDNNKRKEELLKELAEINAKEQNEKDEKKDSQTLYIVILPLLIMVIIGIIGFCVYEGTLGDSDARDNTTYDNTKFEITKENEKKATKWLEKKTYDNKFDHAINAERIDCWNDNTLKFMNGMVTGIILKYDTKNTNDSKYPFELIDPTYELNIGVKNTYQLISKVVIKTDSNRFELENNRDQVEILWDDTTTEFASKISIPQLKSIADSHYLSITMYDNGGDEMYHCDSEEQLSNLKKQIYVGEIFYSLKGTIWNFD